MIGWNIQHFVGVCSVRTDLVSLAIKELTLVYMVLICFDMIRYVSLALPFSVTLCCGCFFSLKHMIFSWPCSTPLFHRGLEDLLPVHVTLNRAFPFKMVLNQENGALVYPRNGEQIWSSLPRIFVKFQQM